MFWIVLKYIVVFIAGFVVGLLVGRRNPKKVEQSVAKARDEIVGFQEKLKKK